MIERLYKKSLQFLTANYFRKKAPSEMFDSVLNASLKDTFRSSRPEVFCKKGVRRNFEKFTGKHLCQSLFFNKKHRLWHRCFPVIFAKFLRTPFLTEHLRWLLLYLAIGTEVQPIALEQEVKP